MYFKHIVGHVTGYAYYATAANLDTWPSCKKIFALQISVNVHNTYTHPLQKNLYVLIWTSGTLAIPLIYTQNTVEGAQYSITSIK